MAAFTNKTSTDEVVALDGHRFRESEHPEVRASRLRREEREAEHQRWMEKMRFVAAAAIVGAVLVVCLGVVV
jgi:hypothetical protein